MVERPETSRLLRWAKLLVHEAEAQRKEQAHRPGLPLAAGLRVSAVHDGAVYRFETLADSHVPEGTNAVLRVEGGEFPAEVLHRGDNEITLFVEPSEGELPATGISVASLVSDPVFLTVELAKRMAELGTQSSHTPPLALLLALCGGAPLQRHVESHLVPADIDLNREQEALVAAALVEPVWFGWGPPGTGKTRALGAYVAEAAARGQRVIVCAHSNVALDAALVSTHSELEARGESGLLRPGVVVRLGVPMLRQSQQLQLSSRELVLASRPGLDAQRRSLEGRIRRGQLSPGDVAQLRAQLAELRAEVRRLEGELVDKAAVLFCTLPKAALDPRVHARAPAQAVVVDEASMATPGQVALAASMAAERLAIIGDFRQLAPIVVSQDQAVVVELGRDVFSLVGVVSAVDRGVVPENVSMLEVQHRMHPEIRRVVGELSYLGRLRDGSGIEDRACRTAKAAPCPGRAIVVVNPRLEGARGWRDHGHGSRLNPISALWAVDLLVEAMRTTGKAALLCPYRAQVHLFNALIRDLGLRENVTVGTIHRMQGSEAPAVVVNLVDAKPLGVPGRLFHEPGGQRLVNVALSRAQGKLIVLADPELRKPSERFKRTGASLAALAESYGWRPEAGSRAIKHASIEIDLIDDGEAARLRYRADIRGAVAVAWLGSRLPSWVGEDLVALRLNPDPPQPDQSIVLAGDVTWIHAERPHDGLISWRVNSRRFADAMFDQLHGGHRPLAPCEQHQVPTMLSAVREAAFVTCPQRGCGTRRRASRADLQLWAIYIGLRCPQHLDGELRVARSDYGWFYRCPIDDCGHIESV